MPPPQDLLSTLTTRTIEKMLDRAAAGSAEHEALQEELRRRAIPVKDTQTMSLFPDDACGASASRFRPNFRGGGARR